MVFLRYMGLFTTFSVFAAFISIVWQAFLTLKQLNKATVILTGLLAIENQLKRPTDAPRPKIAIGYGACTDLQINATEFLAYNAELVQQIGPEFSVNEINDEKELLQTFGYYFQNGAAAERVMPNATLFRQLIAKAKAEHRNSVKWFIGGNAPLMGIRFHMEGADVLLGARISKKLRCLVPKEIDIAGAEITDDDIHLILEYKAGDAWGPYQAPRANRYILHNDQNNPHLNSVEQFKESLNDYKPELVVLSGLQMMDSYKFEDGVREARLEQVKQQISLQSNDTLQHFEMASYVELELLQMLRKYILPYVDSLGMNEQELENLRQVLENGRTTLATDWNPRVATTLDQMRQVFIILAQDYYQHIKREPKRRLISRIHVHTLAYQAILRLNKSKWKNTRGAAAKAALTAYRYVCQTDIVNPETAILVLDDSFAISVNSTAPRMEITSINSVPCWTELININNKAGEHEIEVEICVAPVLVCRVAKKTAGAGDNVSAAGLAYQF